MKTFQMKQKLLSLGPSFTISDDLGNPCYRGEGSFLSIPKTFTITDMSGNQVSQVEKILLSFLPKFAVRLADCQSFFIQKYMTFFRPHYTIKQLDMEVQGDIWDMTFKLLKNDLTVADISKEWLHMTDTYTITVYDETYIALTISLVMAIDYVKALEKNAN